MGFILTSISYDQISDFLIKVFAPVTAAAILGLFAILRKHLRKNYSEEQLIELLRKKYQERVANHPSIKLMDNDKDLLPSGNPALEVLFTDPYTGFDTGFKRILEKSWADKTHRHIELVGTGGMGKTVTMLSLNRIAAHKPAIFVQLNELNDAAGIVDPIKDYIVNRVLNRNEKYYDSLLALCGLEWDNGPRVLLVLDGLNEITDSSKKQNILYNIEEWARMSGIQILCSSRDNLPDQLTNMPPFLKIDVLPLPEDRIISYLINSNVTPPDGATLDLLSNPLLLNLYTKTGVLRKTIRETYSVLFKDSNTKGGIIWNYLQSEVYRISNITRNNEYDAALCIIVSEFIAPCIAYEMLGRRDHSSTEKWFRKDIIKSIDLLNQSILPERIEDHYNILKDHFGEDCLSISIVREALTVKMHLISFDGLVYKFMHQQFRDALAAIHLINLSNVSPDDKLPDEWKDILDFSVMDFVFDLATPEFFDRLWEQNRRCPSGDLATLLQIEIQGKLKNNDFSSLDFCGLDLSNISLYPYESDHCIKLPYSADKLKGTKFSAKSFKSQADADYSFGRPIFVHDNRIVLSSNSHSVLVWDVKVRQLIREFSVQYCKDFFVTPDDKLLFCISYRFASVWRIDGPVNTWRHLKTIQGMGFTLVNGGRMIVFGGEDMNLHIWSIEGIVEDWRELRILTIPRADSISQYNFCLTTTRDGRYLACLFRDKVFIWSIQGDVDDWSLVRDFVAPDSGALSIRATSDSKKLLGAFADHTLWVWSIEGETENWEKLNSFSRVESYDFSPDGNTMLIGLRGSIHQISIKGPADNWKEESLYEVDSDADNSVKFIAVSPNGKFMVSNTDFVTSLWKRGKGRWEHIRNLTASLVLHPTHYRFSSDGHQLVVGDDGNTMVWNLDDYAGGPRLLKKMRAYRPRASSMTISPDGQKMACGFRDGTIRIWSINNDEKDWKLLQVLDAHKSTVSAISISKDGSKIVSGSLDGEVLVWILNRDINQWILIKSFKSHDQLLIGGNSLFCDSLFIETLIDTKNEKENIDSITISDDGELLVCGGTRHLCLISLQGQPDTWRILHEYNRPFRNESVTITSNGEYLICGSHGDGTVQVLSMNDEKDEWQEVKTIDGIKGSRTLVSRSSDGSLLVICSDYRIYVWDIQGHYQEWRLLKEESIPDCGSFALSMDGSRVAVFSGDQPVNYYWNIKSNDECKKIENFYKRIKAGAFTLDGNKLIAINDDKIYVFDLEKKTITHLKIGPFSLLGLDLSEADVESDVRQVLAWNGAVV